MPPEPPRPDSQSAPDTAEATAAEAVIARFARKRTSPEPSPLFQAMARKLRPEHVDSLFQYLTLVEQNRHAEVGQQARLAPTLATAVALGTLLFVLVFSWLAFFFGKPELILPIVTGVVGAIGGYGFGKAQAKKGDPTNSPPAI